jgi:hypothetical protein
VEPAPAVLVVEPPARPTGGEAGVPGDVDAPPPGDVDTPPPGGVVEPPDEGASVRTVSATPGTETVTPGEETPTPATETLTLGTDTVVADASSDTDEPGSDTLGSDMSTERAARDSDVAVVWASAFPHANNEPARTAIARVRPSLESGRRVGSTAVTGARRRGRRHARVLDR